MARARLLDADPPTAIGKMQADPFCSFRTAELKQRGAGVNSGCDLIPVPFNLAPLTWPYFNLHRETFLEHYHKRSNVESAIMSIKTKFGDSVRSKTDAAMRNEVLAKILCHNICCLIAAMEEFGIPVDFGTSPTMPMSQPQLARLG